MNEQLIADLKATKAGVQAGWCHTGAIDGRGNLCVMLHAQSAIGDGLVHRYLAVAEALHKQLPSEYQRKANRRPHDPGVLVGIYNDAPTTTQADIETLIDKALAEAGGLGR